MYWTMHCTQYWPLGKWSLVTCALHATTSTFKNRTNFPFTISFHNHSKYMLLLFQYNNVSDVKIKKKNTHEWNITNACHGHLKDRPRPPACFSGKLLNHVIRCHIFSAQNSPVKVGVSESVLWGTPRLVTPRPPPPRCVCWLCLPDWYGAADGTSAPPPGCVVAGCLSQTGLKRWKHTWAWKMWSCWLELRIKVCNYFLTYLIFASLFGFKQLSVMRHQSSIWLEWPHWMTARCMINLMTLIWQMLFCQSHEFFNSISVRENRAETGRNPQISCRHWPHSAHVGERLMGHCAGLAS